MTISRYENFTSVWNGWTIRVEGNAMTVTNGKRTIKRALIPSATMQGSVFLTIERLKEDIAEYEKSGTIRQKGSAEISLRSLAHGLFLAFLALIVIAYFGMGRFLPMTVVFLIIAAAFALGFMSGKDKEKSSELR